MVKTTKAQRKALFRVFQRDNPEWSLPYARGALLRSRKYRTFRKTVNGYYWDGSGCIMLPWRGMWLGIETDGYTHS